MSAYIVEDKTINRIVNRLVYEATKSDYLKEDLTNLGYDIGNDTFAENLAKDMFELNVSAVRQRYSKKAKAPKFTYTQGNFTSLIQTLKSLNCWVYQCTEGDVPASSLYKFFADVFQKYLLTRIVYEMPEYDRAEWA